VTLPALASPPIGSPARGLIAANWVRKTDRPGLGQRGPDHYRDWRSFKCAPSAEGPAQIRYTCCTSISRWVVAILGGGPLFGTDHARCCSSALDAAADTPRYADPLWSGLKTDSLRHFTGKEVSPMGREGPERRLVAPLNACPLLPRMQERSSLSVYLSFMGASLRNRGQSSARHGITSPQPTRRYTFRAPRFGTGR